ncbi:hypothetical protein ACF3NA_10665 [Alkanindiges sp. WGS2144]|uniref:hypothetical protein n=1 Tax=Alkanindiges sp. WGS2144 TaxID=3366808 RepID=UPI0037504ED0
MNQITMCVGLMVMLSELASAATSGIYSVEEGYYTINAHFNDQGLLIKEPNKESLYKQQADADEYIFTNPTNNITYGIRVVDDSTLEAFKPGSDTPPTTLKLNKHISQPEEKVENNKMEEVANKYMELTKTDPLNTQTWTQCATVAMGYANLSKQEADKMASQATTLLSLIESKQVASSPCEDAIPNSIWKSAPRP